MKLSHLVETKVEPNALLSLRNLIARGGRHRNTFELIVLARFIQLFKDGVFHMEANPLFTASISTNPELLNMLRTMPDFDLAQVAGQVYSQLCIPDTNYETCSWYSKPAMSYVDWMNLYRAREATD